MKVLKFGGTSVGTVSNIRKVAELISKEKQVVVLSAMSGTTSLLIDISELILSGKTKEARLAISDMNKLYNGHISELYSTEEYKNKALAVAEDFFESMYSYVYRDFSQTESDEFLTFGELLSTNMMNLYLCETGVNSALLPALDFVKINAEGEPDIDFMSDKLGALIAENSDKQLFITQGFICRDSEGKITNLKRGGSDYTASLVGAAINAEEIQIWTDIDGMHNNDPRFVEGTVPVAQLNFDEAAELAYFGAKILHPTCILPAQQRNIPVKLLNTMEPEAHGTVISNEFEHGKIKAVAAKDDITAIKIKSTRMLLAAGFLRKIFEIFEKHHTSIDMITTSEVGVSVTIDDKSHLSEITNEIEKYGTITIDEDTTIICVVGDFIWDNVGFEASIIGAMKDIPVRMISYGGSNYNVSLLVKKEDKVRSLQAIEKHIFSK